MTRNRALALVEDLERRGFDDCNPVKDGRGWVVKVRCTQCQSLRINGVTTHETGCPNTPHDCPECGYTHRTRDEAMKCCSGEDFGDDE